MKILVVGDIIFDRYTYVDTSRRSQESNVPVYDVMAADEFRLGGAANVAANIKALSDESTEVHLSGMLMSESSNYVRDRGIFLKMCAYGDQLTKHRFVDGTDIVFRVDNKVKFDREIVDSFEEAFIASMSDRYDAIIVSDYDKGTVTSEIARMICKLKSLGQFVVVDSKRNDLSIFDGADVLNVNEEEYSAQISNKLYTNVEMFFKYVIVTLGARGAKLLQHESVDERHYILHEEIFPTEKTRVVDVTGCGDTHAAAFAVGVLRDRNDIRNAVRFANACATLAVQRFGTVSISKWDAVKHLSDSV